MPDAGFTFQLANPKVRPRFRWDLLSIVTLFNDHPARPKTHDFGTRASPATANHRTV
jgi:hypothetical protein